MRRAGPLVVLLLGGVWLFSSALFSGKVLAGDDLILFTPPMSEVRPAGLLHPSNALNYDSAYVFHPDLIAARRAIRGGELPDWAEDIGAGRPMLAAQQTAPLFPTNYVAYLLPFWDSLEWTALFKLLLAASGMFLFCRALALQRAPALMGAIAFAFSTYFVAWLAHPHTNVYLLLPWLLLAIRITIRRRTPLAAAGLGAVLGLAFLAGHPPSLLLVALVAVPFAAVELAICPARLGAAGLLVGGAVLGLAIGAVMLLPLFEGLAHTIDNSARGGQALPRSVANAFAFPELWGRPDKFETAGGPSNFQERTAYFGVLPLLLGIAGLTVRPSRGQAFFAVAAVLAGLVVFWQGLASTLDDLPAFSGTNTWRCLILIVFCGSVLAAYGLQRLIEADRRERLRMAAVMAGVVVLVGGQWLVRHTEARHALGDALGQLPVLGDDPTSALSVELASVLHWLLLGAAAVLLVGAAAWRPGWMPWIAGVAVALALVDLVSMGRGFHPAVAESSVDPTPPASVRFLQRAAAGGSRSMAEGVTYPANLSQRFQTRDAREHELPAVERTHKLWFALGGSGIGNTGQIKIYPVQPGSDKLADVFAVRWLYAPTLAASPRRGYRPVRGVPGVVQNLDAFPRAWVAHSWRAAAGLDTALAAVMGSSSRQLEASPVIEGAGGRAGGAPPEPARVVRDSDDEVVLSTDSARPGYLVLADTFYPGWKAEVDGREEKIDPANAAFRAIPLAAGPHEVRFAYESEAVRWGWILSLAGLLLTAAVAMFSFLLGSGRMVGSDAHPGGRRRTRRARGGGASAAPGGP
jgi:hypothetical protein